ncbi:MAG: hypothetical protein OEW78_05190 [Nitrosopumilus sp.]|uniref:hypothetical protein n=1 Tax=Nitrosopumilus sp. TaxID=2024843 RepID=UPI0024729F2A|nr:hypothetical protein [Nitrosopumilus sp.]MDH5431262.1 hypothetical protein [Nitrosopumilus sp.]
MSNCQVLLVLPSFGSTCVLSASEPPACEECLGLFGRLDSGRTWDLRWAILELKRGVIVKKHDRNQNHLVAYSNQSLQQYRYFCNVWNYLTAVIINM